MNFNYINNILIFIICFLVYSCQTIQDIRNKDKLEYNIVINDENYETSDIFDLNNISNTNGLDDYIKQESVSVKDELKIHISNITEKVAKEALNILGIDETGLDDMDRRILEALVEHFNGGPVGVSSLAVAVSEDVTTVEDVYEPYLIKEGFIQRTPRGRIAQKKAFKLLGHEQKYQRGLFND